MFKHVIRKKIDKIGRYTLKNEFARQLVSILYHSGFFKIFAKRLDKMMSQKLLEEVKKHRLPEHVAIIMDGNRRFAGELGLDHNTGHLLGRDKLEEVVEWCFSEMGIKVLTVYGFSTENFKRNNGEVSAIMRLCAEELEKGMNDPRIHDNEICIRMIGNLETLPKEIQNIANLIMDKTKNYNRHFLNIAIAYGGRQEILQAIQRIASDVRNEKLKPDNIDDEIISSYLYTNGLPDPDLILRTSGEERISNFLLWQLAYSELYFSDVYWPAFQKRDFLKAIKVYQQRQHNLIS